MKLLINNVFSILNRGEQREFIRLVILDLFISILDIMFLIGLLYVIGFYTMPGNAPELIITGFLEKYPLLLIIAFFLFFTIKNLLAFRVTKMQYHFVYDVASRISKEKLTQYLNGSYSNYVTVDSSVNIRKISQQPIEYCHYVLNGMQQLFNQSILVLLAITTILVYNPVVFTLLFFILLPPVFLVASLMKRKLKAVRVSGKITSERSIQHLQEALAGFTESNTYRRNDFFVSRYHRLQEKLNQYLAENQVLQNIPSRFIEVFAVFGLMILVVLNFLTHNNSQIQFLTIGTFMAVAYKLIPGIVKVMNAWSQVKTYSFTIAGLEHHRPSTIRNTIPGNPINSIAFNNVDFSYPGKKILDSFKLEARKGDLVGISGMSGKGKTTIANLLLGFLEPAGGSISINGTTSSGEERQSYWNRIAYAKQQPFFLHDPLLTNITLQEEAPEDQKLAAVLSVTGVDQLMDDAGPSTIVSENGKNFSGGQRQRIIFARALYKEADLLVLDEPFNELDEASEISMLKHLQHIVAGGKIVLLITHNKSALSFCNKQILMDERS